MYIKLDAATYPSLGSRFDDSFFKFLWQPNVACPEKGIMFYLYVPCRHPLPDHSDCTCHDFQLVEPLRERVLKI